jgi:hypothetical protein
MPGVAGKDRKKRLQASSPPADAPSATTHIPLAVASAKTGAGRARGRWLAVVAAAGSRSDIKIVSMKSAEIRIEHSLTHLHPPVDGQ